MEKVEFKPLSNKLTVRIIEESNVSKGGIIKVAQDQPLKGEVIETGRGVPVIHESGSYAIIEMEVQKGDTVLFPPQTGQEIEIGDEKLLLLTEDHILGILKKAE